VHFEVVEVSGTNQYKVKPAALVFAVRLVPPELAAGAAEAALLAAAAGVLPEAAELLPELAQADRTSATAARPAAPHIFRIRISPS
jgi:hypothetical protein